MSSGSCGRRHRAAAAPPAGWAPQRAGVHHARPVAELPAALDADPAGYARLSYRRAAELFTDRTGHTLHQLRHSALTHAAEDGWSTPMLMARSRHRSVASLAKYAKPSAEAVARLLAEQDPARRNV